MADNVSKIKVKIYYHHTDCGGIVYYGRYLDFFEEALTEFFAGRGIPIDQLAKDGVLFVVSKQEIEYKAPGYYADILEVSTQVTNASGVRIEFAHDVVNQDGKLLVRAKTTMVCVDKTIRPQSLPDGVAQKIITGYGL